MSIAIGFTLQPEVEFLDRTQGLLDVVDYVEVAPETLWRVTADGAVVDNGYVDVIADLAHDASAFVVAHGVGFSLGASDGDGSDVDDDRTALWLAQLANNHARFAFAWVSDHGGLTTTARHHLALPVAVPATPLRARTTAHRLTRMATHLQRAALVEVSAWPFFCGDDALAVAAWYGACVGDVDSDSVDVNDGGGDLGAGARGLLLDLHNVWTMAQNLGFDVDAFLDALPLARVGEIHISGGADSDVGWLPHGRVVRLDSHDDDVPDAVFDLLAAVVPRCPRLRGVTLERMEGTVTTDDDVARLRAELLRARAICAAPPPRSAARAPRVPRARLPLSGGAGHDVDDDAYARALLANDPVAAVHALWPSADPDGVRTAALLIAKLRFERLVNGDAGVVDEFNDDPAAFVARFERYHARVPPSAWHPRAEAALFRAFVDDDTPAERP